MKDINHQYHGVPWKNSLLLLLTAVIWGIAFVAQSVGMDYVGPFTFNGVRSLIGAAVLLPVIRFFGEKPQTDEKKGKGTREAGNERTEKTKTLLTGGILCGLCLCVASNLQQIGIQYTTVGKAGFITACYIVLVPVLGIFLHRRCGALLWGAVALAMAGLYLLCIKEDLIPGRGDILMLLCAFAFSVHILVIDCFSPKTDGVKLSCIQFLIAGFISMLCAFLFEAPDLSSILAAWMPIGYAGVLSCGVAYTLQIIGQKGMNPTIASLILSLESSISVIAGWLLLGQSLSARELWGCALMFLAIILAQFPASDRSRVDDT